MTGGSSQPRRHVAVEGVIGVGKTTLVRRLAQRLDARLVYEEFENNPFLPSFYRDREAFAFSTQIFFLMSRFRQQEVLAQGDLFRPVTLSDYLFDKDRVFAQLTLERHELTLYERLFDVLKVQLPRPDLVIYLVADLEVILGRIKERDRPYERGMEPDYIRALAEAYSRFFASFDECPVICLDTTYRDLRADDDLIERLAQTALFGRGGFEANEVGRTPDMFAAGLGEATRSTQAAFLVR